MDLIKINQDELIIAEEYKEKLRAFKKLQRDLDKIEKDLKKNALEYMEENGIQELDSEVMSIKYVAPFTRKSVDTQALKTQGLYDIYSKETEVKASVRITIK